MVSDEEMAERGGVVIRTDRLEYPVVGATQAQLRSVIELTGPRRGGRVYPAYTDWQVRWSYEPVHQDGAWQVERPEVVATVTVTLPSWQPPANASERVMRWWRRLVERLEAHEAEHAERAMEAARAVLAALRAAGPMASAEELRAAVDAQARAELARFREQERQRDRATNWPEWEVVGRS